MKILVIQQKMIGDVLTSSILFEALNAKFPDAELDYLVNYNTTAVVENNPHISNLLVLSKEDINSKANYFKVLKKIKSKKYTIVIDVYSKTSSNFICLFSGAQTKISYYKWYTSWIYTKTFNIKNKLPVKNSAIVNRLKLLQPLQINRGLIEPKIFLTDFEIESSKNALLNYKIEFKRPIYMMSILGSNITKTYPFNYMAKVLDNIVLQTNGQILFNYIPNQIEDVKTIYSLCTKETQNHIYLNAYGKSLREFLAITYHCNAVIGNEGGAINMAKALNIPTFSIFSPYVKKEVWSLFENGTTNVSIHLKDYEKSLFNNKTTKDLKADYAHLYLKLKPELFIEKLKHFLIKNLTK